MINLIHLTEIKDILNNATTIAVVGLSPKKERPSNMVAQYLVNAGFTVVPVNPGHESLLGMTCYPNLLSVPDKVDIVDIFRKPEDIVDIVRQAVEINATTVWMQQGIVNTEAAGIAKKNKINVIMDRCIKVDHANLFP